jgi:hypothetical protein
MIKTTKPDRPLWVKIIFETPEYIYESMLMGMFPESRKTLIDISTKILVYCTHKRESLPKIIKWVETGTLLLIEWINNNWNKKLVS